MSINEDGPAQPLPQGCPHCPELWGCPPACLELAAAGSAVALAFPLQVFSYHLEHQRGRNERGGQQMDRAQRHRRGEGIESIQKQTEGRMAIKYQKRRGTMRLANSPTPSFYVGELKPEQRANCPSSTNSWLWRSG